ncbi:MAG: sugar ABC transporter ATP-binding protein [Lachnospiraceae bacterium]|nr:sugar ABC transporter ATP-binding protein [Candidatus Equihabitans merdae]
MSNTILSIKDIHKSFDHVTALDGMSFDIHEGQITAIVGDNGSGKSTLIKILSGNIAPDKGSISIDGTDYSSFNINQTLKLGIRTVYQDLSLDNHKNSWENVFLGSECMRGPFLNKSYMRSETLKLIDKLNLHLPDIDLPIRNLSGGQRQGLAIARALRSACRILLLDEPTSAMGIKESHMTMELLKHLRADGITQLLVSHNIYHVFDVADRIIVVKAGKCVADVYTEHSSPERIHDMLLEYEHREVSR